MPETIENCDASVVRDSSENRRRSGDCADDESQNSEEKKKLAEAALFTSPKAISLRDLTKTISVPSIQIASKFLEELMTEFNSRDSALEIVKIGTYFQMKVKDGYSGQVSHLAIDTDLSKAVLRTLALVSVKQPVKQSIVVKIIGNKAYDYVKELSEKGFLKAKRFGNTKILETAPKFETYFGPDAKKLNKQQTLEGLQTTDA